MSMANDNFEIVKANEEIKRLKARCERLEYILKEIIKISDREHDAWNEAKEILNG